MSPYIQQFIDAISPNICWELYPEYIEGFTEHQIDIYAEALDIEINGAFRQWLLTFGKCSGGLFTQDHFNHYHGGSNIEENLAYLKMYPEFRKDMFDDGRITNDQLNLKPFNLYWENEVDRYFILTKDPELFVWFYTDSYDSDYAINTGLKFDEFIKLKIGKLRCRKGIWIDKEDIIEMSSSNIFK